MRALFVIVTVLAAAYAGYWFVGSHQIENRAADALAGLRERGWFVDFSSLDTTGFPSRFDTTVADLRVAPPNGAVEWAAPFLQVFALSYRPNEVIVVWPDSQTLSLAAGREVAITSDDLRASAAVRLSGDLPLREAVLDGRNLGVLDPLSGQAARADRVLAAIRERGGANGYDAFVEVEGLAAGPMSAPLDLAVEAAVTLDRPLDRRLRGAPALLGLTLRDARLAFGGAALTASGELAADAQGYLAGTVTLVAEDWRDLLDRLEGAGTLPEGRAALVAGALEGLAGDGDRIEVPVTFADGRVSALGLPLLDAPRVLPAGG